MTLTFVIRNELNTSFEMWDRWIEGAKEIFSLLKIEPTNCAVTTQKKDENLLKYKSLEKRIERAKRESDLIESISIHVLPSDYTTLIFDFIIKLESVFGNTFLSFNENYMSIDNLDENGIVDILKKMVPDGKGEIFLMDNRECPALYACNINSPDFYKTLKVIGHF